MKLLGYADNISLEAGGSIAFKVSCEDAAFNVEVVKLLASSITRERPTVSEEVMPTSLSHTYSGRRQKTVMGSYCEALAVPSAAISGVGMAAWVCPTLLEADRVQAVVSISGADGSVELTLGITDSGCSLFLGNEVVANTHVKLIEHEWSFLSATVDSQGLLTLTQIPLGRPSITRRYDIERELSHLKGAFLDRVVIGARRRVTEPIDVFNGRVARPIVATMAWDEAVTAELAAERSREGLIPPECLCELDFSRHQEKLSVPDHGGLTSGGKLVNLPSRAVPGPFWRGSETDFRLIPNEYDAIHFHDDDMIDARWETDFVLDVPLDWESGIYALKASIEDETDYVPFVVRSAAVGMPAPVILILPTWTYLAYANWRSYAADMESRAESYGETRLPDRRDQWLMRHPELGKSVYDVHRDGSGVMYSSRLRPIISLRPDYYLPTAKGVRHLGQDLAIVHWLESRGENFVVATDEDLDREGISLLSPHKVVITGSHPEYCSGRMLDAYSGFTRNGGRLMYLGGNGFYQVTAKHPHAPGVIEVRRGQSGVASWNSEPGEEHLSSTGELGGLWRLRGRHPQRVFGVGFAAMVFDKASPYRRTDASHDPNVDWVFHGVHGEVFGDVGDGLGGAAGDELDNADISLGTPARTVILASSFGHSSRTVLAPEETETSAGIPTSYSAENPKLKADLVMFEHEGGGAVFSVGSISWCSAMSYAGGNNDVSRITGNVLDAFRECKRPMDSTDPWHTRSVDR